MYEIVTFTENHANAKLLNYTDMPSSTLGYYCTYISKRYNTHLCQSMKLPFVNTNSHESTNKRTIIEPPVHFM